MISSFQFRSFFKYWLDAVDSHSLHSPFYFDFYKNVLTSRKEPRSFEKQESLRQKLLKNDLVLNVTDLGAGSQQLNGRARKVSDIARVTLSPARLSKLYARMIDHFKCRTIVELGTSLGINSLYLASGNNSSVTTFEGSPEVAVVARDTFSFAEASNIHLIEGDIARTLPGFLEKTRKIDFVLMDANHRYEPTVNYFRQLSARVDNNSIIIVDDIHYNAEMEKAWNEIRNSPIVYGSADIYRAGILFFDPSLNKQHVVLQF
jgi:predicted O-methyltransferase YrrM